MKKAMIGGFIAAMMVSTAGASELQAACEAYAAENDVDAAGCSCLAENADADVTAELLGITSEAELDAVSDATKEVLAACFAVEAPAGS